MKERVAEALLLPALLQVLCRDILPHKKNPLVCTGAILLAGTATAPVLTQLATSVGLDLGEGMITSFAATSLTVSFLVYEAFIKRPYIFVPVLIAVMAAVWVFMNRYNKKKAVLAGGNDVAGN